MTYSLVLALRYIDLCWCGRFANIKIICTD